MAALGSNEVPSVGKIKLHVLNAIFLLIISIQVETYILEVIALDGMITLIMNSQNILIIKYINKNVNSSEILPVIVKFVLKCPYEPTMAIDFQA